MIKLIQPLQGRYPITQRFGENPADYANFNLKGHNGIDYACPMNTPVYTAAEGIVYKTGENRDGYGKYIILEHEGYLTLYAHLQDVCVQTGTRVAIGQFIGRSGSTGNSTGPHLHFELRIPGQQDNGYGGAVDPEPYLNGNAEVTTPALPVIEQFTQGDKVAVISDIGIRIRTGPSQAFDIVGLAPLGAKIEIAEIVEENGNKWGRAYSFWVALEHGGKTLVQKI